ncbi:MAG: EF-hand domain-containing protein [Proteobacteria bacterium]|nr:EF-hand domain-containing protein [Pseudomonadota bacterium]
MLKGLLLMSAAMIAAPALAQSKAAPPASTNAAQPAAAAQTPPAADPAQSPTAATPTTPPASNTPTTAATPAPTGETATPAASATPAPANTTSAVASVVATDWAKYDKDNNSQLSKEEFAAWMTALREQNPAQKAAVKDVNAWTTAAFAQADKDKSGSVTKAELETFLKG